jgi:hypothetical protein
MATASARDRQSMTLTGSICMSRRSLPLAERLRHGLASAMLSAAALAAPSADAASPLQPSVAQIPSNTSRPAARSQASTPQRVTAPPASPSPKPKPKPKGGSKGMAPVAAGCGAHEGGCGPSR